LGRSKTGFALIVNFGTLHLGISYHTIAFFFLSLSFCCSRSFTLVSFLETWCDNACKKKSLSRPLLLHVCFTRFLLSCLILIVLYCFHLTFLFCVLCLGGGLAGATLQVLLLAAGWCGWVLSVFFLSEPRRSWCLWRSLFSFALGTGTGREGGDEAGGREDCVFVFS